MAYFAFYLEPISLFAEQECEHASRAPHARAAGGHDRAPGNHRLPGPPHIPPPVNAQEPGRFEPFDR